MTDQATLESGELTLLLETIGVEDRPVEEGRTLTISDQMCAVARSPQQIVDGLPALLRQGQDDTLPELAIKDTLGEGGMGLVELADQLSVGREVAVKKVRQNARSERNTLVLLREGWTTGRLEHPNIVPVYTLGRDPDGEPLIVMKKIAGTSWLEVIDDPQKAPDSFDADDPMELHVEILIQVCNALHYAHSQGIIHRDLKPENVMLGAFGEVYVLDWGIAVSLRDDESQLARAADVTQPAGTPAYMAPEMVDGDGTRLGEHTDLFLLGAILYEVLTGRPPYSGNSLYALMLEAYACEPEDLGDDVDAELAAISRQAMARDPSERFESARALRDALYDYRRHRQVRRLTDRGDERRRQVQELLSHSNDSSDDTSNDTSDDIGDDTSAATNSSDSDQPPVDERHLYRVFGECRFAYEQALELRPDDPQALTGLQKALEAMADRAIKREAHRAAALLIADLPRPNPDLEARQQALAQRMSNRRQDFEQLQKLRHNVDVNVGRQGRVYFLSIVGAIWVFVATGAAFILEQQWVRLTYPKIMAQILGILGFMAALGYFQRRRIFENEHNRRMIYSVLVMFIGSVCLRGLGWVVGVDIPLIFIMECTLYATGAAMLGVALDRRLIAAGLPFLGTALIGAIWPAKLFWAFAAANAAAVTILVWKWSPGDR